MADEVRVESEQIDPNYSCLRQTWRFIGIYWRMLFGIIWATILLPVMLMYNTLEARCAYVIAIMAGFWVLEAFPMAITSLIPLVLFPVFGILDTATTCSCYMNDTIMVFIGGLIVAVSLEHSNLHMRLALSVMKVVGCSHARLLGGLCTVTTVLSMWVSNTAATAMMVPIIFAVLEQLEQAGIGRVYDVDPPDPENPGILPEKHPTKLTRGYLILVAYSSSFGGTGSLVGTGTNLTFRGIYENTFPKSPGIGFIEWIIVATPSMICNSFLTWLYVRIMFLGWCRPNSRDARMATIGAEGEQVTNKAISDKYEQLGPITFHEFAVAMCFLLCMLLWIFRKPGFIVGWSELMTELEVKDSLPVMFVVLLLFFIPKDPHCFRVCSKYPSKRPTKESASLLNWPIINKRMPWGLMFLLGGGFAISKGSVASCLAHRIGTSLIPLKELPMMLIVIVLCLFVSTITEFTSNVGIANICLPIVAQMSVAMEIHPMYLMGPVTYMCSYAFRFPVGTPPNAIIVLSSNMQVKDLAIAGCIPALYSLIVTVIVFPSWGAYILDLYEFPEWAKHSADSDTNNTCK